MRRIALVMESWERYFTYAWASGMLSKAEETEEDISLYIFNASANWSGDQLFNQGEHNIFMLPDFCDFDGIVVDINNTEDEEARCRQTNGGLVYRFGQVKISE